MSISLYNANGNIDGVIIAASNQFQGSGAGLNANSIPRSSLVKDLANSYHFILNDINGNEVASAQLYSDVANKIYINPSGGNVQLNAINYVLPSAQALGSNYSLANDGSGNLSWLAPPISGMQANVSTSNNTATPLIVYTAVAGKSYVLKGLLSLLDSTNSKYGSFEFSVPFNCGVAGAMTTTSIYNIWSYLDPADSSVFLSVSSSGAFNLTINVNGIAATNIAWGCQYNVVSSS